MSSVASVFNPDKTCNQKPVLWDHGSTYNSQILSKQIISEYATAMECITWSTVSAVLTFLPWNIYNL